MRLLSISTSWNKKGYYTTVKKVGRFKLGVGLVGRHMDHHMYVGRGNFEYLVTISMFDTIRRHIYPWLSNNNFVLLHISSADKRYV